MASFKFKFAFRINKLDVVLVYNVCETFHDKKQFKIKFVCLFLFLKAILNLLFFFVQFVLFLFKKHYFLVFQKMTTFKERVLLFHQKKELSSEH